MSASAAEVLAAYPSGKMAEKDAGQETALGSAYSPVDYMSITSFPRLPEDDVMAGESGLKSRRDEDNFLSEQDTGVWSTCALRLSHARGLYTVYKSFHIILFHFILLT